MLFPVVLAVCVLGCLGSVRYDNYKVYEVTPKSDGDVKLINTLETDSELEIDFWKNAGRQVPAHISVSPEKAQAFLNKLQHLGLDSKVVVNNIQDQIDEVDREMAKIPRSLRNIQNTYYNYAENLAFLNDMKDAYPDMINIRTFEFSREGKELVYAKLSSERFSSPLPEESTKPVIWIEHTTHAREWISNAVALNLIEYLLKNYASDSDVIFMMDTFDWFIVPMANPDGYAYSLIDRMWRKTRTSGSCGGTNGRGNGVDTNRNWAYAWAVVTNDKCASTYQGPEPFSEPCTKYLAEEMDHTPIQHRRAFLSVHSYAQMILTPYAYSNSAPVPNYPDQLKVANAAANAIFENSGTVFQVGKSGEVLYSSPGGADDHGLGGLGFTISLTYELHPTSSNPGFQLPPSQIWPCFSDFFASLKAMAYELEKLN